MCFCGKTHCLFKLSVLGTLLSFALALLGLIPPFSRSLVSIPFVWMLAVLTLIASITVYFNVRDAFWANVLEKSRKNKSKKK